MILVGFHTEMQKLKIINNKKHKTPIFLGELLSNKNNLFKCSKYVI